MNVSAKQCKARRALHCFAFRAFAPLRVQGSKFNVRLPNPELGMLNSEPELSNLEL
jgi:hypothetical protein